MNSKYILFVMALLFVDCNYPHSCRIYEEQTFCEQKVKEKYPYDESLKFEMIHQGESVPFFIFINKINGMAISLEISQSLTQNDIKIISYEERMFFVSTVLEKLKNEGLLLTLTRIYTRFEFWQSESEKMTNDFLLCKDISKVIDKSRLKSDLKKELAQYGMKIVESASDNLMLESVQSKLKDKEKNAVPVVLRGDIMFDVEVKKQQAK